MKIIDVETAVIEANFDYTFVQVHTDVGITGLGECFPGPALAPLIRALKQVIIGQDPRNIESVWRRMRQALSGSSSIGGMAFSAISALECALLDIVGRDLDVPIFQLLGGAYRDEIRIYADCHAGHGLESRAPVGLARKARWASDEADEDPAAALDAYEPEAYAESARRAATRGFTAVKFDLDVPTPNNPAIGVQALDPFKRTITNGDLDYLTQIVAAVVEAVGPDVLTAFDLHWSYNATDALRLAWMLEPYRIAWLEDPIPPGNVGALAALTARSRVPILSGENLFLRYGFVPILEQRAVDVVAPDFQRVGGLLEGKKIADMADAYEIPIAAHCVSSPVGLMASSHVCAAVPNFIALEFHGQDVPFWSDLVEGDADVIVDGFVHPRGPGLGVTLNEEVAREYAKPGEAFFGSAA